MFERIHSTIFLLLFLALFFLNTFVFKQPVLGAGLLVFYLAHFGGLMGIAVAPSEQGPTRWWLGTWSLLSIITIAGSIAYYIAAIPAAVFQGMVLVTPTIIAWTKSHGERRSLFLHLKKLWLEKRHHISSSVWMSSVFVLVCLGLFVEFVHSHAITQAVRSPWDVIPAVTLLLFALATILVFTLLYRGRERALSVCLFALLLLTFLSFVALAYPIGYGFDAFIHKATQLHLAEFGTITPKPFYYIGQYVLVLFFSHAFSLPVDLVDTLLLPVLASLFIPLAWYAGSVHMIKKPRQALFALGGIFLLPLESFLVTTPQGLANLWILLVILMSIPFLTESERLHRISLWLGTISALLIHPIAGIPIFFFACLLELKTRTHSYARVLQWITIAGLFLALPTSFLARAWLAHEPIRVHLDRFSFSSLIQTLHLDVLFQNRFSPLLDFVYLYGQNALLFLLFLSAGIFWMYRKDVSHRFRLLFLMILALIINFLLLSTVIDFSFLIEYERSTYATRLLTLAAFFASPFIILALGHASVNLRTRPVVLKLTLLVLCTAIATSAFYLALPRRDAYVTSHGFNVSQDDVDAVYLIDAWADGKPYLVLANQSVSAAAMKHIGFQYFGNLFFYPIPTGEIMYQKFLAMNKQPSRAIIKDAASLITSEKKPRIIFYVVDTYWWESSRLIEISKSIADDWKSVGGSVYVFRFDQENKK